MRFPSCPMLVSVLVFALTGVVSPLRAQVAPAPSAELMGGIAAYNSGDFAAARQSLQTAANRGEPEAMVDLGYMYARGHGVDADPDYALHLYRRAADAGDAEGMNAVGYRFNYAAKPDFARAIHWYCLAVGGGNPRAMNNLALLFYKGQGVAPDREAARQLWRQAASRGNLNAATDLAIDQASDPTRSDTERRAGYEMLRDAALQGGAFAQQTLRRNGDTEAFPPPSVSDLTMKLEPRDPSPGSSYLCGEFIS